MHITTSQDKSPAVVWKDEQNTQRRWNTIKTFQLKERIDLDRLKRIIRTASMRTEFKDDKAKAAHEADIKMLHVLKQQASKTGRYVVPYTLPHVREVLSWHSRAPAGRPRVSTAQVQKASVR